MSHNGITSIAEKPTLRRDLNAQSTRAEILKVARAAFADRGYSAVTLDEVGRAAKATTGAIYHHFGGKAELLFAVGESVEQEVMAGIGSRIPANATPWMALQSAATATLEICSRPEVARIIFREAPNTLGASAWREVEMRYGLGGLHALFQRASQAGELYPNDPALVTRLMMAVLVEAVEALVEEPDAERAKFLHTAILRVLDTFKPSIPPSLAIRNKQ